MAKEGLDPGDLTSAAIERFAAARRAAGYRVHFSTQALVPLLTYLRELGVVPAPAAFSMPVGPVEELLDRYRRYLTLERGLNESTVLRYLGKVHPFLVEISCDGELELSRLDAADISAFVLASCQSQSRAAAQDTMTALRSLLGFLHQEGVIKHQLSGAVPSIGGWRGQSLPRGLEPDEVDKLLSSCDRTTVSGRRDFAVLTLLSRLGLRAGEVAGLSLEDIEWRAGQILVRGKGREERLPLPADVGEAIVAYLTAGRPASAQGRTVFVSLNAPHRGLIGHAVGEVVARAAHRSGLGPVRSHRLRHTAATQALRSGASLPEVGQLLRHHRIQTTAIYAKVDREALRGIARHWPGSGR